MFIIPFRMAKKRGENPPTPSRTSSRTSSGRVRKPPTPLYTPPTTLQPPLPIKASKPAKYHPTAPPLTPSLAPTTPTSSARALCRDEILPPGVFRTADGRLRFKNAPADFTPVLTPRAVIQSGSFGGIYFNPIGGKPGIKGPCAIDPKEFPTAWFAGLDIDAYAGRVYRVGRNKYNVKAGQDQAFWEESGWINPQDPRGWFQWYCRFFLGRRTEDDNRQISRWRGVAGQKGRWKRFLINKIVAAQVKLVKWVTDHEARVTVTVTVTVTVARFGLEG